MHTPPVHVQCHSDTQCTQCTTCTHSVTYIQAHVLFVCMQCYLYTWKHVCMCVSACLTSFPFLRGKLYSNSGMLEVQKNTPPKTPEIRMGNPIILLPSGSLSLLLPQMKMNQALLLSLWDSLCTQWELNKYLIAMVPDLRRYQLFRALNLGVAEGRWEGEQPWASLGFLSVRSSGHRLAYFIHPAWGVGRPTPSLPPFLSHPLLEKHW